MSKEKLIEIKKGQEGTGLLIENDGYISSSCGNNKQLFEDINAHGDGNGMVCPEHFIVSAVFQKFDIENANGRIYPERILKREVERYMTKIGGGQFGEKRAIGECYTPRAMVLSASGWKPIAEIKEGDEVLTLNTETNEIETQKVTKKIEYQYDGEMYHLKGRNIDDIVTPNHGYPIYDRYGKFNGFYTAEEIYNGEVKDQAHSFIPKQRTWNIKGDEYSALNLQQMPKEKAKGIYLDKRYFSIEKEHYEGEVMCLEVPNHTFYVMDGNKCHWSKNCNHPDDTTIDLSRVALNIIELHWEGHTLVGKLEILTSPGYRKYGIISCQGDQVANLLLQGIKIGVSSRGLGSVTNKMGTLYVGDDFEIVCWDFVSDPSTPNAFVSDKEEVIQRYVEEKETSKPILSEKFEKAMEILKDF